MDDYANYNKELYQMNTNMYQDYNGVVPNSPKNDYDQQRIDTDEPLYENLFNVENGDKEFDNFKANITDRTGVKEGGGTMNFNMLEDFKSYDNMDLDESPQFNVNFDAYYDPLMDQHAITNESNVLFNSDNNQDNGNLPNAIGVLPSKDEFVNTTSVPRVPSQQSFMPHTNSFVSMNNFRNNVAVDGFSEGLVDMKDYNSHKNHNLNNNASNMSGKRSISNASLSINNTNSYYNELSPLTTTTSLTPSVSSVHSTQPSFFSAHQYLTRNSLDHPPSQQHRPSIDFYSKARTSFDSQQSSINQRQRTQIGGRYTSFTNSISNYIPFMGDRNQRTSNNSTPSESLSPPQPSAFINVPPQQAQQPRHLIRSIFKSSAVPSNANNNSNEDNIENANGQDILNGELNNQNISSINNNGNSKNIDNIVDDSEFLDMDRLQQEPEDDIIESNIATKKARRSKRSLFTRFKTPVKMEPSDGSTDLFKTEEALSNNKNNLDKELDNENMETDMVGSASLHGLSINGTPSLDSTNVINGAALDPSTLNNSNNNINTVPGSSMLEPDYGALFEKVGKRKNIVNPATYIRNKPRYKNDQSEVNSLNGSNTNSNSNTEKSSILNYNSSGSYPENIDPRNLNSINSNDSSINNKNIQAEGGDSDSDLSTSLGSSSNTPSSLAIASKRILGSKLMLKRKNSQTNINNAPPPPPPPPPATTTTIMSKGVEVEVDLQSLDLPPTTQIFPTNIINSKNRTRGRKENKEADLVDLTKIYLCNYCSRRFKRQEHLKRHFRSLHTFEKPYDCSICHKKFSRSDNLNQHLKIHKQEEEELAQQGLNTLDNIKTETHDSL
ncbi:unnamed protein product [Debaryomyces tyrocola]|nr:unnamed protein product [Debaryomyces tyrocola]